MSQWVKDTGKEVIGGLQNIAGILRNPGRALASLGQQATDTVEEKGIPYAVSYVLADVAISILVDKGIGKLRGVDQADDVIRIGTKADDVAGHATNIKDIGSDIYSGDLMSPEDAVRYSEHWRELGIGSDKTWNEFIMSNPHSNIDDYFEIIQKQSP